MTLEEAVSIATLGSVVAGFVGTWVGAVRRQERQRAAIEALADRLGEHARSDDRRFEEISKSLVSLGESCRHLEKAAAVLVERSGAGEREQRSMRERLHEWAPHIGWVEQQRRGGHGGHG